MYLRKRKRSEDCGHVNDVESGGEIRGVVRLRMQNLNP